MNCGRCEDRPGTRAVPAARRATDTCATLAASGRWDLIERAIAHADEALRALYT